MKDMPGMSGMAGTPPQQPAPSSAPVTKPDDGMAGMDMSQGATSGMIMMAGALGGYAMMRDASGTAWQPDSTPMQGINFASGGWTGMAHGYVDLVYDRQGGPRGASETFSQSMLMLMAQHPAGLGTLTLRTMLSLDPAMGADGYPLLLQTGETADGVHQLTDRQHPHDLVMELSGTYSLPLGGGSSAFLYVGYPGEPALGPVTFMHRLSGMDDPAAPITHHWLDSTHITYGVVTWGLVHGAWKVEASAFNGREPDQHRWNFDAFRLDSWSGRLSWNPSANWALQASYGFIKAPEQLEPGVDQHRITASATYNRPLAGGNWQTTLAWGRNDDSPGHDLDGVLLESALNRGRSTLFARLEDVQKDELFASASPLAGQVFRVAEASLGYVYDLPLSRRVALGIGAMATLNILPDVLKPSYGDAPIGWMPFLRLKLR